MSYLPVNFADTTGVVKDVRPHLLPPNVFTGADGVRIRTAEAVRILDPVDVVDGIGDTPVWLMPVQSTTQHLWMVATDQNIYSLQGNDLNQIGGPLTVGGYWSGCVLNGVPVISNKHNIPRAWINPGHMISLLTLPNWISTERAIVMRAFSNTLVAIGLIQAGTERPYTIKVSHPADPGTVPISWDETDPTKDVLLTDLADTPDKLVDGLQLGDALMLYKEQSTWALRIASGVPFQVNNVFRSVGLLAKDCVVALPNSRHFVIGQDDIVVHSGSPGSEQSIAYSRIVRDFFKRLSANLFYKTFVYRVDTNKEVVVCFVPEGDTEIREAWSWNWIENTFMPRKDVAGVTFVAVGPHIGAGGVSDIWDDAVGKWNTDTARWDDLANRRLLSVQLAGAPDSLRQIESHYEGGDGTEYFLERLDFAYTATDNGQAVLLQHRFKFYKYMWPHIEAPVGTRFIIQFGYRNTLGDDDPIIWKPAKEFKLRRGVQVSVMIRTKYLSFRISCVEQIEWKMTGFDFDVVTRGIH